MLVTFRLIQSGVLKEFFPKYLPFTFKLGFCRKGTSSVSIGEQDRNGFLGIVYSAPLYVHCNESRFDSYWVDFSDGLYRLGIGGDATPLLTYQPKVNFTVKEVSFTVKFEFGAEWMIDLPCAP